MDVSQPTSDLNVQLLTQGLDSYFGTLQSSLNANVFSSSLPIVGSQLASAGATQFVESTRQAINSQFENLGDEVIVKDTLVSGLFNALGSNGLNILQDSNGDSIVNTQDIQSSIDSNHNTIFSLSLGGNSNFITSVQSDFGLPNFGLSINGEADVLLNYNQDLVFGLDSNGNLFLDTSPVNEIKIDLNITTPNLNAIGSLGLLDFNIVDQGTIFTSNVTVDVTGDKSNISISPYLDASANINLNLKASLGANLPDISSVLNVGWNFDRTDLGSGQPNSFGNIPTVVFNDVKLDLGTFFSNFVSPILKEIQQVTEPIQPIVDIFTKPLPVISDLTGQNITLTDIAKLVDPRADLSFIDALDGINSLINDIPTDISDLSINLGSFDLGQIDIRTSDFDLKTAAPNVINTAPSVEQQLQTDGSSSALSAKDFIDQLVSDSSSIGGIEFPILTTPEAAFKLLLGQPSDLFAYSMPTLSFNGRYNQFFPIIGPLGIDIVGNLGAQINLEFGYDTFGLNKYANTGDPNDIFDGFFVSNLPTDPPFLQLDAGLEAGPGVNLVIASASITGGILANIIFDLRDNNQDGKVRVDEITNNIQQNPLGLFDTSGALIAGLSANITILGIPYNQQIANTTLLDYGGSPEFKTFSQQGISIRDAISQGLIAIADVASALFNGLGRTTSEIASDLVNGAGAAVADVASALGALGRTTSEIASDLVNGARVSVVDVASALGALGRTTSEIASALGALGRGASEIRSVLGALGRSASEITSALGSAFGSLFSIF